MSNNQADSTVLGPNVAAIGHQCIAIAGGHGSSLCQQPAAVMLGNLCNVLGPTGQAGVAIGWQSGCDNVDNAIAIGVGAFNSLPHSMLVGDSSIGFLYPNNDQTCSLGATGASFSDLYLSGNIIGPGGPIPIGNYVSNNTGGTAGNLASFADNTGLVVDDSGVQAATVVSTGGGGSITNDLPVYSGTSGKVLVNSGVQIGALMPLTGGTFSGFVSFNAGQSTNNSPQAHGSFPVSFCIMSQVSQVTVTNTTTDTSLVSAADYGTTTIPITTRGTTVDIFAACALNSLAVDTLTISIRLNGVSQVSQVITPGAVTSSMRIDGHVQFGNTFTNLDLMLTQSGVAPLFAFNRLSATVSGTQVVELFAQWSNASSSDILGCKTCTYVCHTLP
jgi:hypothetical protein